MRICLIGNSHIACLREAYQEIEERPAELVFFGSQGESIRNTRNENNVIVSDNWKVKENFELTSEGSTRIELESFDLMVVHGLIPFAAEFGNYQSTLHSGVFYSDQVLKRSNPFYHSTGGHLIREVRKTSNVPIIASHRPFPAGRGFFSRADSDIPETEYRELTQVVRDVLKAYSVKYMSQPAETLAQHTRTKSRFTKNSKRLDPSNINNAEKHPDQDVNHMNKEFGVLYLDNLFGELALV